MSTPYIANQRAGCSPRQQPVLLCRCTRRIDIFGDWQYRDTAATPPGEVDRQIPCDASQKAAGVAQVMQLRAASRAQKDFLRKIAGALISHFTLQVSKHPGVLAPV